MLGAKQLIHLWGLCVITYVCEIENVFWGFDTRITAEITCGNSAIAMR